MSNRHVLPFAGAIAAYLLLQTTASQGADLLEVRFRSEYPAASKRLEAMASGIRCEGTIQRSDRIVESVQFHRNDGSRILIGSFQMPSREGKIGLVFCRTPDYFFELRRSSESDKYGVSFAAREPKVPERVSSSFALRVDGYLQAAYSIGAIPFRSILDSPTFRLIKIGRVSQGDEPEAIEVVFKCNDPMHFIGGGRATFVPELDWALAGFDVEVVPGRPGTRIPLKGATFRGTIRCRRWPAALVFPETGQMEFIYPGGKPEGAFIFQFTSLDLERAPPTQFKLSAFGIPDTVLQPPGAGGTRFNLWLIGICVAGLGAILGLRTYLVHKRATASSSY